MRDLQKQFAVKLVGHWRRGNNIVFLSSPRGGFACYTVETGSLQLFARDGSPEGGVLVGLDLTVALCLNSRKACDDGDTLLGTSGKGYQDYRCGDNTDQADGPLHF